jgi:hypothetical protein
VTRQRLVRLVINDEQSVSVRHQEVNTTPIDVQPVVAIGPHGLERLLGTEHLPAMERIGLVGTVMPQVRLEQPETFRWQIAEFFFLDVHQPIELRSILGVNFVPISAFVVRLE